jgi:hypothetical protein
MVLWQVFWLSPCLSAFPIPQWLGVNRRSKEGITAAGTAQVSHLIPLHRYARLPNSVAKIKKN